MTRARTPTALKLSARIACGEEWALGPGKADLLEAIERTGSISGGARALGMSYRRAWLLVNTMNRCWCGKLVSAAAGRGRNSGARVTPLGRKVLSSYRTLERRLMSAAERHMRNLTRSLRISPRVAAAKRSANIAK